MSTVAEPPSATVKPSGFAVGAVLPVEQPSVNPLYQLKEVSSPSSVVMKKLRSPPTHSLAGKTAMPSLFSLDGPS